MKGKKKVLKGFSVFLTLIMVLNVFLSSAGVAFADPIDSVQLENPVLLSEPEEFAGGDGTESRPYQIETAEQLDEVRNHLDKYFILNNDIDLTEYLEDDGAGYNNGAGWEPIGSFSSPFTGTFEGAGHTITGLFIDRPSEDYIGLFGDTLNQATITNVGIANVNIIGNIRVGGLVGRNQGEVIKTFVTGNVKSNGIMLGGIAGYNPGLIENSFAAVNVTGTQYLGGLAGSNSNGTIRNSYAVGEVETVIGTPYVGGLVGVNGGTIEFSYFDQETTGQSGIGKGTGKTTTEMKQKSTFVGFNFTKVWGIDPTVNNGYPYLQIFQAPSSTTPSEFAGGDGTKLDPYQIATAEQLDKVRNHLNKHFILNNDIDLTEYLDEGGAGYHNGAGWEPIGSSSSLFNGTFEGAGHTITGLSINRPSEDFIGLFGRIDSSATIANVGIVDIDISGKGTVGGLVGHSKGTIINTYVTGRVIGANSNIGGLVGFISNGSIENSFTTVNVEGSFDVGGLVGSNNDGRIEHTYAIGRVNNANGMGGLVGINNRGLVAESYYDQETTGQSDTGKGIGKTTTEMKQQATFEGFDFAKVWGIDSTINNGYPYLQSVQPPGNSTPNADAPEVTPAATEEDTMSSNGLVITPNFEDEDRVTHFKISEITGGTLYKNDGATPIGNDTYITKSEGKDGLKFKPDDNANTPAGDPFSFKAQAALDGSGKGLSEATVASITVSEVNDNPVAVDDNLGNLGWNSQGIEISFGALTVNDQAGPADEALWQTLIISHVDNALGGTIRIEGENIIFTPTAEGPASFEYTVEDNGRTNGSDYFQTDKAIVSFNIIDPLTELNLAKANENNEDLLDALTNQELDITLPEGFSDWPNERKELMLEYIMYFIDEDYENIEQVQYVVDFVAKALLVYDEMNIAQMKLYLDSYFMNLANVKDVFPGNSDWVDVSDLGAKYGDMSDVEKQIFTYQTKFTSLRDGVAINQRPGTLTATYSTYPSVNNAITKINMYNALVRLRLLQTEIVQYNLSNPLGRMDDFRLNLDKVDGPQFTFESYQQLSQWMLDHRPASGYTTFEEIQTVFDRFFTPEAPNVTANDVNNQIVGLDSTMEYSTDNGATWTSYNPNSIPTFTGNAAVLVRVKADGDVPAGLVTTVTFTTNPAPPSSGGGSTPAPSTPTTEQIVVDVDGNDGSNLTKTPITRTTEANGTVKDKVSMSESIAKDTVEKAKEKGIDTARIIIPDKDDKVSEIRVEIPKSALQQLNKGKMKLEIATENAVISIPTKSISGFEEDLYFRVIPIKSEKEKNQVEERAKKEEMIQEVAGDQTVQVLGRPMEIETNMQSREVSIILPLKDSLPTDPAKRQEILDNLGVFIEHSDGTKELMQGKLVKMKDGSEGIEFTITKFSTFTLIYMDGWKEYQDGEKQIHQPYIHGTGNGNFAPNANVTRAQMAAMLARNLDKAPTTNLAAYKDVNSKHWAYADIMEAKNAGIMLGVSPTKFDPEGSVTRAQMAAIAYRWIQVECKNDSAAFDSCGKLGTTGKIAYKDVDSKHWAREAIHFLQATNIMVGSGNGNFRPEDKLTRAEAVKVLNRLFKRGPLTGVTIPTFKDVPTTHWAFEEIEEAAREHRFELNKDGKETLK